MKSVLLFLILSATANAANLIPYSLSPTAGDSRYVNVTGDTMTGNLTVPNLIATYNVNASSLTLDDLASSSGKLDFKYNEGTDAADGTIYYSFVSSATVGPTSAASDGITNLLGRYRWYTGNNSNAIINGVEGVCSSYGLDESITCRGGLFRSYIAPDATIRTSIGADISARASYSGGTEIAADAGTGFIGARIWMAPYFSAATLGNLTNSHGLWIYNEHATNAIANGIFLSDAGGGFTKDITLQHGESIDNAADGTIALTGNATVSGSLHLSSTSITSSSVTLLGAVNVANGNVTMGAANFVSTFTAVSGAQSWSGNITTAGQLTCNMATTSGNCVTYATAGDSVSRLAIGQTSGVSSIGMGPGNASRDTFLARTGVSAFSIGSAVAGTGSATLSVTGTFFPAQVAASAIAARVPTAAGGTITCTDCSTPYIDCKSTGTAAGAWVISGTANHCQ